ncbi:NEDD4-binding protein 3-A-like isoform X1 [Salvelinus fontinalis]|uniref:NEDD4-binding protein 3-A-like isoform X1 n=1 Tax=Salvelinus fontinalis TaxID=8038 RepID=UPI0024863B5B|nr:NEDD4-binding protein 3-A-like isoform X1 [Salvelinus fontinalis]XP_055783591.1 NEDD4-binding protein 3-A-like isoform X1 [Salvelinus fontinalis]
MATSVQTLPLTRNPSKTFRDPISTPNRPTALLDQFSMGSVGSLVERPDASPAKGRAVPQVGPRQTNRLLKKGFNQRELLNYLNITRKEAKAGSGPGSSRKDIFSSMQSMKREHGHEEERIKFYHKDRTEVDVSKNSLPIRGKYEKSRLRPSAFKPVTPKNFSSMQNLYPAKIEDSDQGLSNGLHRAYVSSSSSSSSPSRHGGPTSSGNKVVASVRGMSQEDENLSDSGHNSMNSLPPYRPPFRPQLAHIRSTPVSLCVCLSLSVCLSLCLSVSLCVCVPFSLCLCVSLCVCVPFSMCLCVSLCVCSFLCRSVMMKRRRIDMTMIMMKMYVTTLSASMSHINTIGSLDRASKVAGSSGVAMAEMAMSCRSMATLSRLTPYGGEAPPPYELSFSVEEVVRDLEERLAEKEHELKQMRRNLDESEGAIAQVFEGKQRLWEKELEELKHLYAAKLRQVSQHAQHSQHALQLQLHKAQQEKNRLQDELDALGGGSQREGQGSLKGTSPTLEETQWQVCQKSGEISLLKQQLRDSQAEVTSKLSELFQLKTQLRETRGELQRRDGQIDTLQTALQGAQLRQLEKGGAEESGTLESRGSGGASGPTEERLRAELLLERRQSEAQATVFEQERQTWQTEKEKVICYQRELQASYLDMYHHNQLLERELYQLRGEGGGGTLERELYLLRGRGEGGTLEREQHDVRGGREGGGREMGDYSNESLEREVQEVRRGRGGGERGEEDSIPPPGLPWIERIESSEI